MKKLYTSVNPFRVSSKHFLSCVFMLCVALLPACNSTKNSSVSSDSHLMGSPEEISEQIDAMTNYINIQDSVKMTLNIEVPENVKLSRRSIEIGEAIVSLNNKLAITGFQLDHSVDISSELLILEPFFSSVAESNHYMLDSIESKSEYNTDAVTHCPQRNYSSRFWSSEAALRIHLLSIGFHRVPNYATLADGPNGYSLVDFSVFTSSSDIYGWCGFGTYRTEAAIARFGNQYTYYIQVGEPNPEVFSYNWYACPGPWWAGFVAWWHCCYC